MYLKLLADEIRCGHLRDLQPLRPSSSSGEQLNLYEISQGTVDPIVPHVQGESGFGVGEDGLTLKRSSMQQYEGSPHLRL